MDIPWLSFWYLSLKSFSIISGGIKSLQIKIVLVFALNWRVKLPEKDNLPFSPAAKLLDRVLPTSSCPLHMEVCCSFCGGVSVGKEMEQIKQILVCFYWEGWFRWVLQNLLQVQVLGAVVCFTWTFAFFFFPLLYFQSPTYPKQPLKTKRSFKTWRTSKKLLYLNHNFILGLKLLLSALRGFMATQTLQISFSWRAACLVL